MTNIISYIFIGNANSLKKIIDYSQNEISKQTKIEINMIFSNYCSSNDENNKNQNKKEEKEKKNYYYKISLKDIFYLIIAEKSIEEELIFNLMEKIENEQIPFLIDNKTNVLKNYSKIKLKNIFEDFNKNRKLSFQYSFEKQNSEKRQLNNTSLNEKQIFLQLQEFSLFNSKYERISFQIKIVLIIILILLLIILILIPFIY